jgi:hypothetical protein
MAGPAYYTGEINISKNEDWLVPFLYQAVASDGVTTTPIDLTGSLLKLEIRMLEADHEAIVGVFSSPDDGIVITNAVGGTFTILIDRARSARLAPGQYVTDLVRLMPSGYQERMWEGTATVIEGTTR